MTNMDSQNLQADSTGLYRSVSLPRIRGYRVNLPAQIDQVNGLENWQQRADREDEIIVVDLFCGAGGLSLGFEDAGFFVAVGIDHDPSSIITHGANFLSKGIEKDISSIEDPREFIRELGLSRVDVIIGGPPCQGFSRVGRGKLRSVDLEEYYTTVINELYNEFIRFVEDLQPLAFVMENVPDMATFNGGELISKIINTFNELGYKTELIVLDAADYGVPQHRRRLFIQGNLINASNFRVLQYSKIDQPVTVRDAIGDLPSRTPPSTEEVLPYSFEQQTSYQRKMRQRMPSDQQDWVFDHIIRNVREDDKIIFSKMQEGDRYNDIPVEFRRYRSDIFKDKYWKLVWDKPAWTVTAHIRKDTYRYIHPDVEQGRMLSIREFARLQSFPDHFRFCGTPTRRMQQIGNAVPPLLAQTIASQLYTEIRNFQRQSYQKEEVITQPKLFAEQQA